MTVRHKNIDIQRMIQDIGQLRAQNKTDKEIRIILEIKERTYQRYVKMLYKRNEDIWIVCRRTYRKESKIHSRCSNDEEDKQQNRVAYRFHFYGLFVP